MKNYLGRVATLTSSFFPKSKWLLISLTYLQEIDLRIGASFTRFQTLLLKDAFVLDFAGDDRSMVLSYGPCQVCCISA
jgi:hypothetical protein